MNESDTQNDNLQQPLEPAKRMPQRDNSQFLEARKALRCIGNSKKSHKNQLLSFALKYTGKSQGSEMQSFNRAAEEGNFAMVISILASQKNDDDRSRIMNEARLRGAEVTMPLSSAGHNHKGWYDLTPLALAAKNGHANIVEYLLRQGADPTLRGSPSQHEDFNALEAAKQGVKIAQQDIDSVLSGGKDEVFQWGHLFQQPRINDGKDRNTNSTPSPESALDMARALVERKEQRHLCLVLLESVEKHWPLAQGYSSHYRKRLYNNKPKDIKALRTALDTIALESHVKGSVNTPRVISHEYLVNRLAGKIAAASAREQQPKQIVTNTKCKDENSNNHNGSTCSHVGSLDTQSESNNKRKARAPKSNRGRRHSDSFMIPPPPKHRPVLKRAPSLRDKNIGPNIKIC